MEQLIESRILVFAEKLDVIGTLLNEEMQKPYRTRNRHLLAFLAKERDVYRFALGEMENLRGHQSSAGLVDPETL